MPGTCLMDQKLIFKLNSPFDDTIQSYINIAATTLRPNTIASYKIAIKNFISFLTSYYPHISLLSDLKRSPHIEEWLSFLAKNEMKNGTRYLRIIYLRKFFDDIYYWDWKDTPRPGLITNKDIPPRDKHLPKPITPEDDRILQEKLKSNNLLSSQALLLLRKTGMRIGELMDLDINCLEKSADCQYVLHVPIGKLHTQRIVPVDSETVKIINRIKKLRGNYLPILNPRTGEPTQFLLVRKNVWQRFGYTGLRGALLKAARSCGIKYRVSPHMLRHTYATELLRCGIALPALMKLLGHNDIDMTLRYTDVCQKDLRESYFNAIQKSKSLQLLPKTEEISQNVDNPESMLDEIYCMVTKIRSLQRDCTDRKKKKRLQRLAERLHRAFQELKNTL